MQRPTQANVILPSKGYTPAFCKGLCNSACGVDSESAAEPLCSACNSDRGRGLGAILFRLDLLCPNFSTGYTEFVSN